MSCGGPSGDADSCELAPYSIQVDVQVPADLISELLVHWSDQSPDDGVVATEGFAVASLRRDFATRIEAETFRGPFLILVGGEELARFDVDFSACEFVATLGHEPQERTQAVFRYSFQPEGATFGPGSNVAYTPTLACMTTTGLPWLPQQILEGCSPSERHMVLYLGVEATTTKVEIRGDGALIAPRTIGQWGSGVLVEIDLPSARGTPVGETSFQVGVTIDGQSEATAVVNWSTCAALSSAGAGHDPETLVYERRTLTLEGGALAVDEGSGVECMWANGTILIATP